MNKENNITKYQVLEGSLATQFQTNASFISKFHRHLFIIGEVFFIFKNYSQLITILMVVIISTTKQKLLIQPTDNNESACNDFTVLSCDLHNLFEVVRGLGIPFVG